MNPAHEITSTVSIRSASQTGAAFTYSPISSVAESQSSESHITKNTTIHLSDLGGSTFSLLILSILENTSISRGKIIRLESIPAAILSAAQAITTTRVPVENPPIVASQPMKLSSLSMVRPRSPPSKGWRRRRLR